MCLTFYRGANSSRVKRVTIIFFVLNQWIKVTLKNVFEIIKEYNLKDSVNVLTHGVHMVLIFNQIP